MYWPCMTARGPERRICSTESTSFFDLAFFRIKRAIHLRTNFAPASKYPEKTIFFARAVISTKPPAPAVTCDVPRASRALIKASLFDLQE